MNEYGSVKVFRSGGDVKWKLSMRGCHFNFVLLFVFILLLKLFWTLASSLNLVLWTWCQNPEGMRNELSKSPYCCGKSTVPSGLEWAEPVPWMLKWWAGVTTGWTDKFTAVRLSCGGVAAIKVCVCVHNIVITFKLLQYLWMISLTVVPSGLNCLLHVKGYFVHRNYILFSMVI